MNLPFQFSSKKIIKEGKTTQSAIDSIDKWLETTSLPHIQEEFILLFLLSCLNDITETKKTIEAYFRVKNKAPNVFNGWDIQSGEMQKLLKIMSFCVIPMRMNNNTAIVCAKLRDTNYRKLEVITGLKLSCMLLSLSQIRNPPDDVVIIIDMKGIGFMHLTCIKMGPMMSHLEYVQEGMPLRIRNIHILNTNYVFDRTLDLFKVFIKNELISNIKTHPPGMDVNDFHKKWVPISCLPEDYGGSLPSVDELMEGTIEELRKMGSFFQAEEQMRRSYKM